MSQGEDNCVLGERTREGKMIEVVIGAIVGAAVSALLAEVYYRRASRGLNALIDNLNEKNEEMGMMLCRLAEWQGQHSDHLRIIRKHAVVGTPDDPLFPYK